MNGQQQTQQNQQPTPPTGGTPGNAAPSSGTQQGAATNQSTGATGATPKTFDEVLAKFDEPTKTLFEEHVSGLRTSLQSERDARKKLDKDLRELTKTVEATSPLKSELEKLTALNQENTLRADFNEEAHRAGVLNLRLAFLAARDGGMFDDKGRADFVRLKRENPELFRQVIPPGNAAPNTPPPSQELTGSKAINANIRRAVQSGKR